ncbi:ribosome-binding factor A [candidate division WOR-1 bacterium RIFOXYC2_FULL_37_10]|uniref:Ribosome-binding factor A n=1 Tax=candidate division WOR-1 bacterium RIFOXYB2_FULL_37_13 TaxID=1802579 RepID=A0A1F4SQ20_UNCSA|nr:MAG: ribosome-binding factor A [candidate division WOR-1 bacterium RIFOXYA2_FULL_37_7]OGC22531.1 MAG: ribosome-binding factor A [candidate division WOR-1 bacterium RIFOXYB2_FULL_37_13]OGC34918.1 MAG: ribosome-binding factor A [candidate division WOR-1 bacterium RIFOXYC2_FULL_37_10]
MSRTERIAELIKKEVSMIIRERVSDPRIGFVSLTDVDVPPDLKTAKIFFSVLGDETVKKNTIKGLKSATPFIRGELAHKLEIRFVPKIFFVYDKSLERGSNVLSIMNKIESEKN